MTITRAWIDAWGAAYGNYDEGRVESLFAKERPTHRDVRRVYHWKSPRSIRHFDTNAPRVVTRTVRSALDIEDPASAMDRLLGLRGVQPRTGSAILAVFRPERFTVMDTQAWATLRAHGMLGDPQPKSWRARWPGYLAECLRIASINGVSLRELDRALWKAKEATGMP